MGIYTNVLKFIFMNIQHTIFAHFTSISQCFFYPEFLCEPSEVRSVVCYFFNIIFLNCNIATQTWIFHPRDMGYTTTKKLQEILFQRITILWFV